MKDLTISGTLPMTNVLLEAVKQGKLTGMSNKEVSTFLSKNLGWGVALANGTLVESCDVPGLRINVAACEVQPANSMEEFPVYGPWQNLEDVGFNA